jgi:hypothetical protein
MVLLGSSSEMKALGRGANCALFFLVAGLLKVWSGNWMNDLGSKLAIRAHPTVETLG